MINRRLYSRPPKFTSFFFHQPSEKTTKQKWKLTTWWKRRPSLLAGSQKWQYSSAFEYISIEPIAMSMKIFTKNWLHDLIFDLSICLQYVGLLTQSHYVSCCIHLNFILFLIDAIRFLLRKWGCPMCSCAACGITHLHAVYDAFSALRSQESTFLEQFMREREREPNGRRRKQQNENGRGRTRAEIVF